MIERNRVVFGICNILSNSEDVIIGKVEEEGVRGRKKIDIDCSRIGNIDINDISEWREWY